MTDDDPIWKRLEEQIAWYDRKSGGAQRWFKGLKVISVVGALLISATASAELSHWIPVGLGILIALVELLQGLNQYQHNWITYRSTAEYLKHEKYLFLAKAGPYAGVPEPRSLLAERVESLVSQEHAKWVSAHEEAARKLSSGTVGGHSAESPPDASPRR